VAAYRKKDPKRKRRKGGGKRKRFQAGKGNPKTAPKGAAARGSYTGGGPGFGPQTVQHQGSGGGRPPTQVVGQGTRSLTGSPARNSGSNSPSPTSGVNDAAAAPARTPAQKKHHRQVQRYRETMRTVKRLERSVKEAEGEEKKQQREKLRDALEDAKKPQVSTEVVVDRLKEAFAEKVSDAERELREDKPFGIDVGKVLRVSRAAVSERREKENRDKRYARAAAPGVRRIYRNASPKKRAAMREAGLSPSESRYTIATKRSEARDERQATNAFVERRKKLRKVTVPAFGAYKKGVRKSEIQASRGRVRREVDRKLRPQERKDAKKDALSEFSPAGDRMREDEKYLKHLGVVPEQGEKFFKVAKQAAEDAPGKKTRQLAKKALAQRADLEGDLGRGRLRVTEDGRISAFTPRKAQQLAEKAARKDLKAEEEAEPDTPGEVLSIAKDQLLQAVNPASWAQLAEAGWEAAKGGGHDILYLLEQVDGGGQMEPYHFKRVEEMAKQYSESSPVFGFAKALLAGENVRDAFEVAAERATTNPLGAAGEALTIGAGGVIAGQVARYGVKGRHTVNTARPNAHLDARERQNMFDLKSGKERRRDVKRQRQESQQRAREDVLASRRGEGGAGPTPATSGVQQFYSRSPIIRTGQKVRENLQVRRGKDPFAPTGRRANKLFKKAAERVPRRGRPANLALGAGVAQTIKEAEKAAKDRGAFKPSALRQAAIELLYDGTVRHEGDGSDYDADLEKAEAVQRQAAPDDPSGISAYNAELLNVLRTTKAGRKAMRDRRVHAAVNEGLVTGRKLDDLLVDAGYITAETAARRRAVAGPVARGEAGFRKAEDVEAATEHLARAHSETAKAEAAARDAEAKAAAMGDKSGRVRPAAKVVAAEARLARATVAKTRAMEKEKHNKPAPRKAIPEGTSVLAEADVLNVKHPRVKHLQDLIRKKRELQEKAEQNPTKRAWERVEEAAAAIERERKVVLKGEGPEGGVIEPQSSQLARAIREEEAAQKNLDAVKGEQRKQRYKQTQRVGAKREAEAARGKADAYEARRKEVLKESEAPAARELRALEEELERLEEQLVREQETAGPGVQERSHGMDKPSRPFRGHVTPRVQPGRLSTHEEILEEITRVAGELREARKELGDTPAGKRAAEEAGIVWLEGEQLGRLITGEDRQGGYLDYQAVDRGEQKNAPDIAGQGPGRLTDTEVITGRKIGDGHLRASLESRNRLLGMVRLRQAMMQVSPFKRAMPAAKAAELVARLNRGAGQVRYVVVAAGKGGDGSSIDGVGLDITRAPREGELAYVVPEVVVDVWNKTMKPPGRVLGVMSYATQKIVSAVLPLSVVWHAGNVVDLTTRLVVSGVNPFSDPKLARALKEALTAEDEAWGLEVYAHLQGHLGSREGVVKEADFGQALASFESDFMKSIRAAVKATSDNGFFRKFFLPRNAAQLGFNVATREEAPFVDAAIGVATRRIAEDLGVTIRDHAELAQRMVREFKTNPELIEEFGRRTVGIIGDYGASPFGKSVLQAIDPFWLWVRESVKFVMYTFPAGHPVKFALGLQAANLSWEAASALGLNQWGDGDLGDVTGFLAGAIPVAGMPGWFRPMSPMTSWGEVTRLVEDPWSYALSRPLSYIQRPTAIAAGNRDFINPLESGFGELERRLGISIPGFDAPSVSHNYTGNKAEGILGELVTAFVPGMGQVETALTGGFPSPNSNLFDPEATPGTEVPWYENRALNPVGRSFAKPPAAKAKGKSKDEQSSPPKPDERAPRPGEDYYTSEGVHMVWDASKERYVAREGRVRGDEVRRGKAKGEDAPKKSPRERKAAIDKLVSQIDGLTPTSAQAIADASRKYDVPPEVIAAIYDIETDFSRTALPGVTEGENSSGAGGPMQFIQGTWDAYGVDGDGDGTADRYSEVDAIHGAANYLAKSGATTPEGLYDAIFAYNHADWYVQDVLETAKGYRSKAWRDAGTGAAILPGGQGKAVRGRPPVPDKHPEIIGTPYVGTHTLGNWQSDNALDIAVPTGTPILATRNGVIGRVSGDNNDPSSQLNGFQVYLNDDIWYTHLSKAAVSPGDKVKKGDVIGYSGAANGVEHLHFAVMNGDPAEYVSSPVASGGSAVNVPTSSGGSSGSSAPAGSSFQVPSVAGAPSPGSDEAVRAAATKRRKAEFNRRQSVAWALRLLQDDDFDVLDYVSRLRGLPPIAG
jgi:murein DD-endopeptidase MepM/ murein hydrolase activator NlpD